VTESAGIVALAYAGARVPVRGDLPAAHARAWRALAAAGAWWDGAERVALAAETRAAASCRLCRERRASLSPAAVAGRHARMSDLPESAIEAVHRIATDPGRLSRGWLDALLADGLGDGRYVELVGVVSTVVAIDSFCRALGVAPHPLPEPRPGEPSRRRPEGLGDRGAWVPMTSGRVGHVMRALALAPGEVATLLDQSAAHYVPMERFMDLVDSGRALDRAQMELVAARVSALRECFY
jgi:hypothetical protein